MGQCLGRRQKEKGLSRKARRNYSRVVGDEFDDDDDIAELVAEGGGLGDDLEDGVVMASPISSPTIGQGFAVLREESGVIEDADWD